MIHKKQILIFAFILLFLVGGGALISNLLNVYLVVSKPITKADAIILMAGGESDRLPAVVELYNTGITQTVLVTNDGILGAWSRDHSRNLYQAEWSKLMLINNGVPKDNIVILDYTQSGTYFDALNTRKYVQKHNLDRIAVLTSDYHTRRTVWTFEKVFSGYPLEIGVYSSSADSVAVDWSGCVRRSATLIYEYIKLIYYKLRFGLLESMSFSCSSYKDL